MDGCGSLGQLAQIAADGGHDIAPRHLKHGQRLNVEDLAVVFEVDLIARLHLSAGIDMVLGKERHVLVGKVIRQRFGRRAQVQQTAALRLCDPRLVITVALEEDALVLDEHAADERLQIGLKVRAALERISKLLKALGQPPC